MQLISVKSDFHNLRIDKFLCQNFNISFGLAQKLIREKKIKVNKKRVDASYKIQESDQIEIHHKLEENAQQKQKNSLKISSNRMQKFLSLIIFEDENIAIINKPSGLAVQGGTSIDISVDDFAQAKKWQLVHRLDKDTSGILILAKNKVAAEFLTDSFRNKTIRKTYLALVHGQLKKKSGTINIPLKKQLLGKNEKVRPNFEEGKEAISHFKLLKNFADFSLLELSPVTGRTHQLRVHCKEIGHAILNDVKYGGSVVLRKDLCRRLCLHAAQIEISDYFGSELKVKTPLPDFLSDFSDDSLADFS